MPGIASRVRWLVGGQSANGWNSIGLHPLRPLASGRQRPYIGLEATAVARPRLRGYADAVSRLAQAG
jgi:hypothetical protein